MWFKGDQTRFHPFNAGCIYKTGVVCLDQGKVEAAVYVFLLFLHSFPSFSSHPIHFYSSSFLPALRFEQVTHTRSSVSKHLRDSLEITKFHADIMPVEHARNLFKLSEALKQRQDEAKNLRDKAKVYLLKRIKDATEFENENVYDRWVPIFWR